MSDDKPNTQDAETRDTQSSASDDQNKKTKPQPKRKKAKTKKSSSKKNKQGAAKRGKPAPRPFPANTLEDAIRIPTAIKINGGNPWPPPEVAKAIHVGAKTSVFWYLSASSRDYGLTTGTSKTDYIALDAIGRDLLYAASPEIEREALRKAFFNIGVFKSVYEYYKGGNLPDLKYLQNTLESVFNVPPQYHQDFLVYTRRI